MKLSNHSLGQLSLALAAFGLGLSLRPSGASRGVDHQQRDGRATVRPHGRPCCPNGKLLAAGGYTTNFTSPRDHFRR